MGFLAIGLFVLAALAHLHALAAVGPFKLLMTQLYDYVTFRWDAADLRRLVGLYLRESFAEEELSTGERESLKGVLGSIFEAIKVEERRRRRRPRPRLPAVPAPA